MTEIWYTPHDENRIEEIFEAMKHCQSLHPDSNGAYWQMKIPDKSFFLISLKSINLNANCVFFVFTDSFSEEEDEFIMAEENNHVVNDDIDQEDIRNLHIDGNLLLFLFVFLFVSNDHFAKLMYNENLFQMMNASLMLKKTRKITKFQSFSLFFKKIKCIL